ncbi:unnamed protein product [Effrenium voratum]|nr:unnamed protein product [Effrenium voratum]CAJ1417626.1 unnamed protein product [Effrenium voratum]
MGARLGVGVGLGLGLGSLAACLEVFESADPSQVTQSSLPSRVQVSGRMASLSKDPGPGANDYAEPRTPSTSNPVSRMGKLTLHTNHSLPHPALRHTDSWRRAFYVHHPDQVETEDDAHEVSELMVFAAMFALLHIAMLACKPSNYCTEPFFMCWALIVPA